MHAHWETAVTSGDLATVRLLIEHGIDVNARDRHGQTGLMLAAHRGHLPVVEALVGAGADLNATAKFNLTALMLAVIAGHADVARLLARAGADPRIEGSGAPGFLGKTAYDLARDREMEDLYTELKPE